MRQKMTLREFAFVAIVGAVLLMAATPIKNLVFQGDVNASGYRITNLGTPSGSDDAATKGYVDGVSVTSTNIFSTNANGLVPACGALTNAFLRGNGTWSMAGGVTSIAVASPLTGGTITNSGTISLAQAGGGTNGYLSGTDWTTFNNKLATNGNGSGLSGVAKMTNGINSVVQVGKLDVGPWSSVARIAFSPATIATPVWEQTVWGVGSGYAMTIGTTGISTNSALFFSTNNYVHVRGGNIPASEALEVNGNVKTSGQFMGSGGGLSTNSVPVAALSTASAATNKVIGFDGTNAVWRTEAAGGGGGSASPSVMDFRLSLESGVPVSTSDQTAKTTLYLTPYNGSAIGLKYSGSWTVYTTAEISGAIPSNASTVSDVFAYWTGSAVALEFVSWTNDTTRATALARDSGILVKSGDATRRYIGTIRTTSTSGRCEDTANSRLVWNCYNRCSRWLTLDVSTSAWTYSAATVRVANGDTSNYVRVVNGLGEDSVSLVHTLSVSAAALSTTYIGIGVDSTSTFTKYCQKTLIAGYNDCLTVSLTGSGMGFHSYYPLEKSDGTTQTFSGSSLWTFFGTWRN